MRNVELTENDWISVMQSLECEAAMLIRYYDLMGGLTGRDMKGIAADLRRIRESIKTQLSAEASNVLEVGPPEANDEAGK